MIKQGFEATAEIVVTAYAGAAGRQGSSRPRGRPRKPVGVARVGDIAHTDRHDDIQVLRREHSAVIRRIRRRDDRHDCRFLELEAARDG